MIDLNKDIRIVHTAKFSVLWQKIKDVGTESPKVNELTLKAALDSGLMVGGLSSDVDDMKTCEVIRLSNIAIKAFVAEMRPPDDPN